jgi:hypothetical protein
MAYIAVSEWGYGLGGHPADAILKAQEHVPLEAKPSQMQLFSVVCIWEDEWEEFAPLGFKNNYPVWPNGKKPKLVGLTNTHQGFIRRIRI